ncbi:hypothetical protein KKE78_02560, partial [Patescibacteria group bacterium]|nr:hypothetical protein [Patescibacteria group bacterium]
VGGNVLIDKSVTQVDAVIISSGKIYTATNASANPIAITTCSSSSVPAGQLVVNGSLISLDSSKPIEFCRKLANNSQPAEQIIHQPKYLIILRNLFADTMEKWSEIQ